MKDIKRGKVAEVFNREVHAVFEDGSWLLVDGVCQRAMSQDTYVV
jgi:hypothetical protein